MTSDATRSEPNNPMRLPDAAMPHVFASDLAQFDVRRVARSLFWRSWSITAIAAELGLPRNTVDSWKKRDKWEKTPMIQRMEDDLYVRWAVLIHKDKKTGSDFKEIDLVGRQMERLARIRRYEQEGGHEGDLNPNLANRNAGPKKKAKKNHFTAEQVAQLREILEAEAFDYQNDWMASSSLRTRMILKSRQIGATYYFAREALLSAVEEGRNKIWLSASKAQAHQARAYMIAFAALVGVSLTGEVLSITSELQEEGDPPAEIRFLGTNILTAQGYHGDFYFDEFFWVHNFETINKVASGMAMHKKWRKTYMSAPSSVAHGAHPFWTGERRNRNRKKAEQIKIDVNHKALKSGAIGPDRIWRHIVTVEDAEAGGCDLFDIEELRDEYSPDEFANLLMCQFVDDSLSAFKFNDLMKCTVDSWLEWEPMGFAPLSSRPFGNRAVWAGYDPQVSADGDNAALTIALPPEKAGDDFLLLEKHQLRGMDFQQQSAFIHEIFRRYNVTYFGIDATGIGEGVYQLVKGWFPRVMKLEYSLDLKNQMVMKAQNVIRTGRLKFDAGWTDVIQSFLGVKKAITPSGRNLTFKAGRGGEAGHSDLAWSIMNILINEPLDGSPAQHGKIKIFGDHHE
jgi:uncharacterized protein YjcR